MSAESLRSEVEYALSHSGPEWEAAAALITDFLRALHELMFKSNSDQTDLFSQVQTVFGSTTMHHLARTLHARPNDLKCHLLADDAPLYRRVVLICKERGFELEDGRHVLAHFIKALDEERRDRQGNIESAPVMLYWGIGPEAAYHLVGLYMGDDQEEFATELCGYLDPKLKRFDKLVEMWEMERNWEREEAE